MNTSNQTSSNIEAFDHGTFIPILTGYRMLAQAGLTACNLSLTLHVCSDMTFAISPYGGLKEKAWG